MYNNYLRQQGLKGRQVSSLQEVYATPIDFDGSIFFFPDLAENRIYTKCIQQDGTAKLNMYELKEMPVESNNNTYISKDEFDKTIEELKELIAKNNSNNNINIAKQF